MTELPRDVDKNRTVLETHCVDDSDGWWTGLVRDRDEHGEIRLRLERLKDNGGQINTPHVWRVRSDFWQTEREAVEMFQRFGGQAPPAELAIDSTLTPLEYLPIRRDEVRHVALVRLDKEYGGECTRLYHWDSTGAVRQKWTVTWNWSAVAETATRRV